MVCLLRSPVSPIPTASDSDEGPQARRTAHSRLVAVPDEVETPSAPGDVGQFVDRQQFADPYVHGEVSCPIYLRDSVCSSAISSSLRTSRPVGDGVTVLTPVAVHVRLPVAFCRRLSGSPARARVQLALAQVGSMTGGRSDERRLRSTPQRSVE